MKQKSLTPKQQELAAKNHNLIYEFAKRKNIVIEEYYDILAIGLCKAALYYNPAKGEFSRIENVMKDHWKLSSNKKRIPEELISSYNVPKDEENVNGDSFMDDITDGYSLQDMVESELLCSTLMNLLNGKEQKVIKYILQGYTQREIADIMNFKQPYVAQIKNSIKQKWKKYINNDNS